MTTKKTAEPTIVATGRRRRRIERKIDQLAARDGLLCVWCSKELTRDEASIDHLIPSARCRTLVTDNLVLSCSPCNGTRGDLSARCWLESCLLAGQSVRADLVEAALARAWASDKGSIRAAAVLERCYELERTSTALSSDELVAIFQEEGEWLLEISPEDVARHYLFVKAEISAELAELATEVAAASARFPIRRDFVRGYAAEFDQQHRRLVFLLRDGHNDKAYKSARRLRHRQLLGPLLDAAGTVV